MLDALKAIAQKSHCKKSARSQPCEAAEVIFLQGWICNSSICMTRRGLKPTGIAIFDAQQQGFLSVAHHVQVSIPLIEILQQELAIELS